MKALLTSLFALSVVGCTAMQDDFDSNAQTIHSSKITRSIQSPLNTNQFFQAQVPDQKQMFGSHNGPKKNINHYVRGMMQDLASNLKYVNQNTPLAVASFVFLDDKYDEGTLLGNQISESFMHELYQYGIPVIDFKTTGFMRVTPKGDFVFSRDYLELDEEQNFQYVMAGTLVNHKGGVLVNVRVIGLQSKAVVGSAQGLIPQVVLDALGSSERTDGIMLKSSAR
jgi:TolB-like protein